MLPTLDAANRLISMEVKEARLYYYKHDSLNLESPNLERLPSLSPSEFKRIDDVIPVRFDRDAISFTQTDYWDSAVLRLAMGDYTLQSLAVEEELPRLYSYSDAPVMVAHIICHGQPKCEITTSRRKNRNPVRLALRLEKFASQMHLIRIEFGDTLSWWKVSSPRMGWTNAAVKTQLEELFALYTASKMCELDPEPACRMPFHLSNRYKFRPLSGPEASPWSEAESDTVATPTHRSPSSRNSPKLPLPTVPSPLTSRALTSTLLPQPSATTTILHHPRVLKRKLDEMIVHYDEIEEEEKKSMASCREKKEKLWADWRSTDPPTPANPQHPAGLKRKLEEMEVKYNRIEDEEKEVTVRCHEKKEKLWEDLSKGIPLGHRDGNDRERQRA